MERENLDHVTRKVRAGTLHGTVEGDLLISQALRTLDFLNRSAGRFVTLERVRVTSARWQPEGSTCSVSVATILWVAEIEAMRPSGGRRRAPLQNRSAVRLCMPECEVRGFLHTPPPKGDPIVRLNQDQAPFFALTSASVVGEDAEFAAAFLAVNRSHVFAAEALAAPEADIDEPAEAVVLTWDGRP